MVFSRAKNIFRRKETFQFATAQKSSPDCPMSSSTTKRSSRLLDLLRRIVVLCLIAVCIGWILHKIEARLQAGTKPAGFIHGMLQGALMPLALPNLLVGNDVTIYAPDNTGRTYKLGYTVGVNACGALFFGVMYWRVSRWRKAVAG
jgi:F0F1-type ATP synthase assembly protein I